MRTAWISSVIFSFVAVLGVGGFSFFLISSKSDNREQSQVSQDVELADDEVFASAILPNSRGDSKANQNVSLKPRQSSNSDDDYEIFESDDVRISDLVLDDPASSARTRAERSDQDEAFQASTKKLNMRGRLSYRATAADDNVLSRRVLPTREAEFVAATTKKSDRRSLKSASRETQADFFEDVPEEMEPDLMEPDLMDSDEDTSDLSALAALNKFSSNSSFQPRSGRSSSNNKSFRNLLEQDSQDFEEVGDATVDDKSNVSDNNVAAALNDDVIAIIVNRENSENISIADVKNIYVDKRINWGDGKKIVTYNLPLNSHVRELFSQSVLDMSAMQAATEASNRVITNSTYNLSHTKADRLVISYVARNRQAIGYVPLKAAKRNSKVRIILTMKP